MSNIAGNQEMQVRIPEKNSVVWTERGEAKENKDVWDHEANASPQRLEAESTG